MSRLTPSFTTILSLGCLIFCMSVMGEESTTNAVSDSPVIDIRTGRPLPPGSSVTQEELKARNERLLRHTGGILTIPAKGPRGLFMDARENAPKTLATVTSLYQKGTRLEADFVCEPLGKAIPLEAARARMASAKALFLILVADGSPDSPALSVYPDERIGVVCASALAATNDAAKTELRIAKETWRALGFIGGLGFSQQDNDIMQPVDSVADLDANAYAYIQPMNMLRMQKFWNHHGVTRPRRIPYKNAVKEGWASPPTNDYQKAVWDEVKAAGTNAPTALRKAPPHVPAGQP